MAIKALGHDGRIRGHYISATFLDEAEGDDYRREQRTLSCPELTYTACNVATAHGSHFPVVSFRSLSADEERHVSPFRFCCLWWKVAHSYARKSITLGFRSRERQRRNLRPTGGHQRQLER